MTQVRRPSETERVEPKGERLAHEPELVTAVDARIRLVLEPRDRPTDLAEELVRPPHTRVQLDLQVSSFP